LIEFFLLIEKFIILMDNNLEVFMKRKFMGLFLVASVLGLVGCAAPSDSDAQSLRERCFKEPQLPECQELPAQEEPTESVPIDSDF
jgi:hypothetical protein